MTAPSTQEALERLRLAAFKSNSDSDKQAYYAALSKAYQNGDLVLATFQPDGETREAIARIERAASFYRGMTDTAVYSGKHVANILETVFSLASGLMQDEAGVRADERERCAEIADLRYEPVATEIAAAIRSARDGGAET